MRQLLFSCCISLSLSTLNLFSVSRAHALTRSKDVPKSGQPSAAFWARMLVGELGRFRDVRVGPDGLVYLLSDSSDGKLWRLEPC